MKILNIALLSVVLLITVTACCSGESDYQFELDNYLFFSILDKQSKLDILESINNTTYNYDTVNVYDENWGKVLDEGVDISGDIVLLFVNRTEDKGKINSLIEKRYYMYFNHQDIDTIDVQFKMNMNECDQQVLNYFKVSYNDSVYFDKKTNRIPHVYFLK